MYPMYPMHPMYSQDTLEKYAQVLVWALETARGEPLKSSALVLVRYDSAGLPLAEALVRLLHEQGRIPVSRAEPTPAMEQAFYAMDNYKRMTRPIPGQVELYQALAGEIRILAPEALDHLAKVEPDLYFLAREREKPVRRAILERGLKPGKAGPFAATTCLYPTPALAKAAGMSPEDYASALKRQCMLTSSMPLNEWRLLKQKMDAVLEKLNALKAKAFRVRSKRVDLLFRPGERRVWRGLTGGNVPGFEFYISPDWRSVEGEYFADQASIRQGNLVRGLGLSFRGGQAMHYRAETGQTFSLSQFMADSGAARVGEFSLIDKRFSTVDQYMAHSLADENHAGEHGSCHLGMGQSLYETFAGDPGELTPALRQDLGFNDSILHWDLVNTEDKQVTALLENGDKQVIYEQGSFTL